MLTLIFRSVQDLQKNADRGAILQPERAHSAFYQRCVLRSREKCSGPLLVRPTRAQLGSARQSACLVRFDEEREISFGSDRLTFLLFFILSTLV